MDINHIIEPERHGLWIAAGFIVALLALVLGLAANQKVNTILVGTQAQILVLHKQVESMKANQGTEQSSQSTQGARASVKK